MKIVYAISAPGHVNPMLGIVRFWWGPLSTSPFETQTKFADAYLQLTLPSFEFPRTARTVRVQGCATLDTD
jgi:hypothetical protein